MSHFLFLRWVCSFYLSSGSPYIWVPSCRSAPVPSLRLQFLSCIMGPSHICLLSSFKTLWRDGSVLKVQSWAPSSNLQNPHKFGHAGTRIYDLSAPTGRQEAEIRGVPEPQSQHTRRWEQNKDPVSNKGEGWVLRHKAVLWTSCVPVNTHRRSHTLMHSLPASPPLSFPNPFLRGRDLKKETLLSNVFMFLCDSWGSHSLL